MTHHLTWPTALDGFADWLRAASRTESTIKLRRYWLTRLAHDHPGTSPVTITTTQITVWLATGTWQPSTRKSALGTIRRFFTWMDLNRHRPDNPTTHLLTVPTPTYRARPIPDAVLTEALTRATTTEDRLLLLLPALAGLRRAETAALHTSAVNDGWLHITGKGGRTRNIPIHLDLAPMLALKTTGYYFPSPRTGYTHRTPDNIGKRITRLLGGHHTPHQLRHWFATRTYAATGDLRAVQELLGHASIHTTQTYVGIQDTALTHAITALATPDLPPPPAPRN